MMTSELALYCGIALLLCLHLMDLEMDLKSQFVHCYLHTTQFTDHLFVNGVCLKSCHQCSSQPSCLHNNLPFFLSLKVSMTQQKIGEYGEEMC